jgi:energy-coupling factor transporter transmembrane protein EcfT
MLFASITIFTASDQQAAFQSTFFLQSLLAVTLLLFYLLIVFNLGSSVNEELEMHRKTLMTRQVKVRARLQCAKMSSVSEEEIAHLEEVEENINISLDAMDINNQLKPFQILGFNAQRALTVSIATAAISYYSTLLTAYIHSSVLTSVTSLR